MCNFSYAFINILDIHKLVVAHPVQVRLNLRRRFFGCGIVGPLGMYGSF